MDRHLNFVSHVDAVSQKCTGMLIALMHARHVVPRSALKRIVEALVISVLRYCLSVYGSCGETQLTRVQKIINFCARVVSGRRRRDSVSAVIKQLKWLTAKQLATYHSVSAVERILVTGQPEYLKSTMGQRANQRHQHNTRRASFLALPTIRTEAGRRRLCYRGVTHLNKLNIEPGLLSYRVLVRKALLSRPET